MDKVKRKDFIEAISEINHLVLRRYFFQVWITNICSFNVLKVNTIWRKSVKVT